MINYKFETLTVSTVAVPFTATTIYNLQPFVKLSAFVTIEGNNIRYRFDGTAPTSTVGHLGSVGETITFDKIDDIMNFKAIKDSLSAGDSTLTVSYKNER